MARVKYSCDGCRPVIVDMGQSFDAPMHYAYIAARRKYGFDAYVLELHELRSYESRIVYSAIIGRYNDQAHCCTRSQAIVFEINREEIKK